MAAGVSAGVAGLLWCLAFVILEAIQAVFFGGLFQRMDSFLIGFLVFGLTSAAAVAWTCARAPQELARAWANLGALVGMNVTAAGGWVAYLLAIQLIEPAVAFTIFSGSVPLTMLCAGAAGAAGMCLPRNALEASGNAVVALGLITLAVITAAGLSGFVRGELPAAMGGVGLAALSGAFVAMMLFYCRKLDQAGVGPVAQLGLRFLLYDILSLGGLLLALDAKEAVPAGDVAIAVAVGLALMAFPIYAVQKAVALISPLTIGAVTALGPLFVFGFQTIEDRVDYAQATLIGLAIYVLGSMIAATGSVRAVRRERLSRRLDPQ